MNNIWFEGKEFARGLCDEVSMESRKTRKGGVNYLIFGEQPSMQSKYIRLGKKIERWFEFFVKNSPKGLVLLRSGVDKDIKTDIDLNFRDDKTKTIFYRELKANINLDSEKMPATIEKSKRVHRHLQKKYPDYKINSGALWWSVYDKEDPKLAHLKSKYKAFRNAGVTLDCASDFFDIVGVATSQQKFEEFFASLGERFTK